VIDRPGIDGLFGQQPTEPYFCYSATLRIWGIALDHDYITEQLGLRPTSMRKRGHRHHPSSPPAEHDRWQYTAAVAEEAPLDDHLEALWSAIRPGKDFLLKLKEQHALDVFCGYRTDSHVAGFTVRPASLKMFLELDVPFGISIVVTDLPDVPLP
jgi:hypothetical protein